MKVPFHPIPTLCPTGGEASGPCLLFLGVSSQVKGSSGISHLITNQFKSLHNQKYQTSSGLLQTNQAFLKHHAGYWEIMFFVNILKIKWLIKKK